MENPYEWDDEQLLREFAMACARSGVLNSGLIISSGAGRDNARMSYLWIALEARLARANPPFKLGQQVKPIGRETTPSPIDNGLGGHQPSRTLPAVLTVASVWYYKGRWDIKFKEEDARTAYRRDDGDRFWLVPLRFRAEDFEVPVPATT